MKKLENTAIITSVSEVISNYEYDSVTKVVDNETKVYETLRIKELNIQVKNGDSTSEILNLIYDYDIFGNIGAIAYSNEIIEFFTYDIYNQLTMYMIEDFYVGMTRYHYDYDNRGNIKSINIFDDYGSKTISYTYKQAGWLDQLASVTKIDNDTLEEETYYFSNYDASGNPLNYKNYTVEYDERSITRLIKGSNEFKYSYNAKDIRTSKSINGNITNYILDGSLIIKENRENDLSNPNDNQELKYYYDSDSNIIAFSYNNNLYRYVKNLQNDIIGIVDNNGNLLVEYMYDAYGNISKITDTSGINLSTINPFRFKSYYSDEETSFYYCNARYYDSEIGRWINADDISYIDSTAVNGLNLYSYCGNNPVMALLRVEDKRYFNNIRLLYTLHSDVCI